MIGNIYQVLRFTSLPHTTNINIIDYFQDKTLAPEAYGEESPKKFNAVTLNT